MPAGASTSALAVDAGVSHAVQAGEPIEVAARVGGGVAPFAYAWTLDGSGARFADPAAAATTFDTTGLAGAFDLLLEVTDATGATARDTVRHHAGGTPSTTTVSGPAYVGVPDEIVGAGVDNVRHTFTVAAGSPSLSVVLDWGNALNDLDFRLYAPDGSHVGGSAAETGAKPERLDVANPAAGTWTVRVRPFASVPDTYEVATTVVAGAALPIVDWYTYEFGVNDSQHLYTTGSQGQGPYGYAWDLDDDGVPETQGQRPYASFPVGSYPVRARVTDAQGFEAERAAFVDVLPVDRVLRLACGNDALRTYWAMEFSASRGTCWMHGGHHTFFFGNETFRVLSGSGEAYSVEQQFSPPTATQPGDGVSLVSPLHVQLSMDGLTWWEVADARYVVTSASNLFPARQGVSIEVDAPTAPFRYLRVHNPPSAAQGLSGFLDHVALSLQAERVAGPAAPSLAQGTRALDCARGDHLEDFFAEHPCWFGGINRYDAPSFFHTYPLGETHAVLSRVSGEFTLAPWRTDDWTQGEPAGVNWTATHAFVQVSFDGTTWKDAAIVNATFGVPQAFEVELGSELARFVRLLPAYHARYDQHAQYAPNHHPEGFIVDSRLVVEGMLPTP